jgi:hypothetical protein
VRGQSYTPQAYLFLQNTGTRKLGENVVMLFKFETKFGLKDNGQIETAVNRGGFLFYSLIGCQDIAQ